MASIALVVVWMVCAAFPCVLGLGWNGALMAGLSSHAVSADSAYAVVRYVSTTSLRILNDVLMISAADRTDYILFILREYLKTTKH